MEAEGFPVIGKDSLKLFLQLLSLFFFFLNCPAFTGAANNS